MELNFGNMSKTEALTVIDEYFKVVSGLQSMKHQQNLELGRIRWSEEKKVEQQRYTNSSQLIQEELQGKLQAQEHKSKLIRQGRR